MENHPHKKALRAFIRGELSSEEARLVERHLSMCSECRDRADEISDQLALQLLDSWLRPGYDEAFERAADRTAECLSNLLEESRSTEDLLAELLREPAPLRRRRIVDEERFHSLKLCQVLQSRSRNAWFSEPASALEMADLAVEVALHLKSGRYGSGIVEDARAVAWAYLGNTFRILSDFWKAEQALHQAWDHHLQSGGDAYTEAELLMLTASLREDQCRDEEAERLSDQAIRLYREGQDPQLEGSALILKGSILSGQNRIQEGISVIQAGIARINPVDNPLLLITAQHNIIWSLNRSGASGKARELLERSRPLYGDLEFGEINMARLRWLDGIIARDLRDFDRAESVIQNAREFFLARSLVSDFFFSSIDLAMLFALSGRPKRVKEALREVIPMGEALGLFREAMMARILFERASRS